MEYARCAMGAVGRMPWTKVNLGPCRSVENGKSWVSRHPSVRYTMVHGCRARRHPSVRYTKVPETRAVSMQRLNPEDQAAASVREVHEGLIFARHCRQRVADDDDEAVDVVTSR